MIAESSARLAAAAHPTSETAGEINIMQEKKSAVKLSILSDDAAQWLAEVARPTPILSVDHSSQRDTSHVGAKSTRRRAGRSAEKRT